MFGAIKEHISEELNQIKESGLFKAERILASPQRMHITIQGGREVLNMCANNYLGLADNPEVIQAAKASYDKWGFGLSSVRFICGTQQIHKELERKISEFLCTDDAVLYSSCFDANGGLFETLLTAEDAVVSDALNHASIIDGIRLCKARRFRFKNCDMQDLEEKLKEAQSSRFRLIATDGVFSMDGIVARTLKEFVILPKNMMLS
jgi:glycine C-acetyltransferase